MWDVVVAPYYAISSDINKWNIAPISPGVLWFFISIFNMLYSNTFNWNWYITKNGSKFYHIVSSGFGIFLCFFFLNASFLCLKHLFVTNVLMWAKWNAIKYWWYEITFVKNINWFIQENNLFTCWYIFIRSFLTHVITFWAFIYLFNRKRSCTLPLDRFYRHDT